VALLCVLLEARLGLSSPLDSRGFLREVYPVHELPLSMRVRQVPGDGNCLFNALSVALHYAETGQHGANSLPELRNLSGTMRQLAVDVLTGSRNISASVAKIEEHFRDINAASGSGRKLRTRAASGGLCLGGRRRRLYLEHGQRVSPEHLVQSVAETYDTSCDVYCQRMRQDGKWGGGPEIVALSNALRRPIHVYELLSADSRFFMRLIARFGSPKFDDLEALHILSADSRFPSVRPGDQSLTGNHFLALFPCEGEAQGDHLRPPNAVLEQFKPDAGPSKAQTPDSPSFVSGSF